MNIAKRRRTSTEFALICDRIRKGWVAGDPVQVYLRQAFPVIDQMIHFEGIHLADVVRALNAIGITYQGGREWSPHLLSVKLSLARSQLKREQDTKFQRDELVEAVKAALLNDNKSEPSCAPRFQTGPNPPATSLQKVSGLPEQIIRPAAARTSLMASGRTTPAAPTNSAEVRDSAAILGVLVANL